MIQPFSGPMAGFCCDDTNVPPHFLTDLGAKICLVDWCVGDKADTFYANCEAQAQAGLKVVGLVHDRTQAKCASQELQSHSNIQLAYKNEIDMHRYPDLMDGVQFTDYANDCRWLADRGIQAWIGCLSTVRNVSLVNGLMDAIQDVLPHHLGLSFHGYGCDPGHLHEGVGVIRTRWQGPILMSEWGPQPVKTLASERATWFSSAWRDILSCGIPGVLYRLIDPGDSSGFVHNRDWTTAGYSALPAYGVLKAQLGASVHP